MSRSIRITRTLVLLASFAGTAQALAAPTKVECVDRRQSRNANGEFLVAPDTARIDLKNQNVQLNFATYAITDIQTVETHSKRILTLSLGFKGTLEITFERGLHGGVVDTFNSGIALYYEGSDRNPSAGYSCEVVTKWSK